MHCFSSLWVLGLVRQARGWVTLLCPCLPPPREPGGTGRSRVVREDLPPPSTSMEERAESCTWDCAKRQGNLSLKMPPG